MMLDGIFQPGMAPSNQTIGLVVMALMLVAVPAFLFWIIWEDRKWMSRPLFEESIRFACGHTLVFYEDADVIAGAKKYGPRQRCPVCKGYYPVVIKVRKPNGRTWLKIPSYGLLNGYGMTIEDMNDWPAIQEFLAGQRDNR